MPARTNTAVLKTQSGQKRQAPTAPVQQQREVVGRHTTKDKGKSEKQRENAKQAAQSRNKQAKNVAVSFVQTGLGIVLLVTAAYVAFLYFAAPLKK
jgi:hypothetical protein